MGVSVVIILFWTSFNGMAPAEPWSPYRFPATFLLGAILLVLALASWIEKLRDREGDLKVPHASDVLRVLVVDDECCNRMLLQKRLTRLGFKVTAVQDGFRAVEAAYNEPWDLILMDGQMPEMDGLEATRLIRSRSRVNRNTLIVAVTGNTTEAYRRQCLAAGMDGFYGKPSTTAAVDKLIRDSLSLLSSRDPHRSASIGVWPLR